MEFQETAKPEVKPEKKQKTKKIIIIAAIAIGGFLIVLASFASGVVVGLKKAKFSYHFGENYERNFIGPRPGHPGPDIGGFLRGIEGRDFRNAHGLAGSIISVTDNNLVIKDRDGKENTVAVTDKTIIKSRRENLKLSDLKAGDQIVVLGNPAENGVVNADLIRVFVQNMDTSN
jgi:RNase P/RNase MRP subunit p29